jgi:hypothetical protein
MECTGSGTGTGCSLSAGPCCRGIEPCVGVWPDSACNGETVWLSVPVLPAWREERSLLSALYDRGRLMLASSVSAVRRTDSTASSRISSNDLPVLVRSSGILRTGRHNSCWDGPAGSRHCITPLSNHKQASLNCLITHRTHTTVKSQISITQLSNHTWNSLQCLITKNITQLSNHI